MRYELVLRGEIGDRFGVLFEGMRIARAQGTTVLTGAVRDQAHLHGLIERISELGIELVSVNPIEERQAMTDAAPDTIVLVHGFWVTPRSWEHWIAHYEGRGFRVIAPAYPGFEVEVEALRADPTPIEKATLPEIVAHYEKVIDGARQAADHHRPLRRRRDHADPARPRPRRRRRRAELGADRGRAGHAALADPLDVRGAQEPRQPPQGRRVHARAVALRVHERLRRGGVPARSTSATTSPRRAASSGAASWPTSSPATRTRGSTTTTTTAPRCCSSPAARTTSCRRPSSSRTTSTTSPTRSRRSSSSRARTS